MKNKRRGEFFTKTLLLVLLIQMLFINTVFADECSTSVTDVPKVEAYVNFFEKIELGWENDKRVSHYEIEKDSKTVICVANIPKLERMTYVDREASLYITHTYRFRSVKEGVEGNWSESIVLLARPVPELESLTSTSNLFTWNKVNGASEYEIDINGVCYTVNEQEYTDTKFSIENQTGYRVRAKCGENKSIWSKTLKMHDDVPELFITKNIFGFAVLNWNIIAGTDTYEILINGDIHRFRWHNTYITYLPSWSKRSYKVRAIKGYVKGSWSNEIIF